MLNMLKLKNFKQIWVKYTIFFIFIILVVICAILSNDFLTQRNIFNLLRQQSFLFIVSLGMLFTIITGGIDLSVGAMLGLSAILTTVFIEKGISPFLSIIYVLFIGIICGLSNGLIIDKGKVNPFIATLATMSIFTGFSYIISHGHPIFMTSSNLNPFYEFIGKGYLFNVPFPVIFSIILALIVCFILQKTVYGRLIFGVGGNREAARFSGIRTSKYIISAYLMSGFFCSISGIIFSSRLKMAHPGLGQGYELDAIAAVIMGGGSFTGGKGSVFGTIIGVLILGLIRNLLNLLNIAAYPQLVFKGAIILIAIFLSNLQTKAE